MSLNSGALLVEGRKALKAAGIESYSLDALLLLAYTFGKTKEWLLSHERQATEAEERAYFSYIGERCRKKPVQYIINAQEFMGLPFYVDENVLIPRADTEILAQTLIELAKSRKNPKVLELCTGSGCIAVACAYYAPEAHVTACDISADALKIAERNGRTNGVSNRINFILSDLFEHISGKYDIIAANPPYIPCDELEALPEQVRGYEPLLALDGGEGGLELYRKIAEKAAGYLNKGGKLLFEIGFKQAEAVCQIMNSCGYNNINIYRDLAGNERTIEGALDV